MDKKHVSLMLDTLVSLDEQMTRAYYEMGQILHAFKESKLYTVMGYESFTHMVEEELSFGVTTAHKYANAFGHFKRLGYKKNEAVELITEYGLAHMSDVLPDMKTKVGPRAISKLIEAITLYPITFTLDKDQLIDAERALEEMGVTFTDEGRMKHSTAAFMQMVQIINGQRKAA